MEENKKNVKISKEYALQFYNKIPHFDYSNLQCKHNHYITFLINNIFEPDMSIPFLSNFIDCDIPIYVSSELNEMLIQCGFSNGLYGNNII